MIFRRLIARLLLLSSLAALATAAGAQSNLALPAVKSSMPILCDCDKDAPCWKNASPITGFVDLAHGNPVTDQTQARILYDSDNIYVLIECSDSKPDGITGRETVRDTLFNQNGHGNFPTNEDYVIVTLDPFLTHQNADISTFGVNPLGTRSAQIAGGRAAKAEWNGDWEASAKRTPSGWICQMRIPWKMLHHPAGGKTVTIGFDVARFQYRTQTMSIWSNLGPQLFWEREGAWQGVELPKEGFKHTFSALPYAIGGVVDGQLAGKTG
ncbi:MAG TPA: carbohydrate binding family 9 domain-containing protein, partial [Fimbriimonadaceae bacterium]|nr:carbohydrate binding family 9 domain-containing protein [Fimbriimonadaceae bacterium]